MARRIIDAFWDRKTRNDINNNFKELYDLKNFYDNGGTIVFDGSPKGVFDSLEELEEEFPKGDDGIYIVDGDWYYWEGSKWDKGGTYQASKINKKSIDYEKLDVDTSGALTMNEMNPLFIIGGIQSNGELNNNKNRIRFKDKIKVKKNTLIGLVNYENKNLYIGKYEINNPDVKIEDTGWMKSDYVIDVDCHIVVMLSDDDNSDQTDISLAQYFKPIKIINSEGSVEARQLSESVANATYSSGYSKIHEFADLDIGSLVRLPQDEDSYVGKETNNVRRIRSKFIKVNKGTIIRLLGGYKDYLQSIYLYNEVDGEAFGATSWIDYDFVVDRNCYVRVIFKTSNDDRITPEVIEVARNTMEVKFAKDEKVTSLKNLVSNGDMSNGLASWSANSTLTLIDGWLTRKRSVNPNTYYVITQEMESNFYNKKLHKGHKYYLSFNFKALQTTNESSFDVVKAYVSFAGTKRTLLKTSNDLNVSQRASIVYEHEEGEADNLSVSFNFGESEGEITFGIKDVILIDLTEVFGSGNEPKTEAFDTFINDMNKPFFDVIDTSYLAEYLLKGMSLSEDRKDDLFSGFYFADELKGIYEPNKEDLLVLENLKETTTDEIYGLYNDLMDEYPDYISRIKIGEAFDGQNIYCYSLIPNKLHNDGTIKEYSNPVFGISSGTHGDEKGTVLGLYNVVKLICENWKSHEHLEFFRFNTDFLIVPVVNPSGFDEYKRNSTNNKDINRSFPLSITKDGEYSNREPETQAIIGLMQEYYDELVGWIDYHNKSWYGDGYLSYITGSNEVFQHAGAKMFMKLGRKWQDEYPTFPQDDYHDFAYNTIGASPNSMIECANQSGIPAAVLEMTRKIEWLDGWELHDADTMKITVETLIYFLKTYYINTMLRNR